MNDLQPRARPALRLRRYLAARLMPLVTLLVGVVSLSAPLAFYVRGLRTLRVQADAAARRVARVLSREAQDRPLLWKYDSLKLLDHVRTYDVHESIERIDIVDVRGLPLGLGSLEDRQALASAPLLWQSAPVLVSNERVGEVWVATPTVGVRQEALVMLIPFGLLGFALGGLMYWLPLRTIGTAEERIRKLVERLEESQAALAELNENLEHQVEERSSELASAYRELQRKEKRLREISSRAVSLQEAERRAIGRDLHDSAGQSLTAIRIHLQLIGDRLAKAGQSQSVDLVERTTAILDDTLEEIRRAVGRLGPSILDEVGLKDAVVRMCDDLHEQAGLEIECEVEATGLSPAVESTCYRVAQEALTNVMRHAEAGSVEVSVRVEDEHAVVEVADDGRGFALDGIREGARGLAGMRERVEILGGTVDLRSTPGEGTTVSARIPVGSAPRP